MDHHDIWMEQVTIKIILIIEKALQCNMINEGLPSMQQQSALLQ